MRLDSQYSVHHFLFFFGHYSVLLIHSSRKSNTVSLLKLYAILIFDLVRTCLYLSTAQFSGPLLMNYLWLFFIQLTYITQCVYGDDVGPYFDPQDGEGWDTKYGGYPFRSFKTSNLTSPVVRRMVDSPECYDGRYTFFSPRGTAVKAPEPLILDDKGHLVWALDSKGMQPYNFKVQEYQGQQHLTYWLGNDAVGGHGEGYYYMVCISTGRPLQ